MTVVFVTGTGTEVGKTWVGVRLAEELRRREVAVLAYKPAQSFDPTELGTTDADLLGAATAHDATTVCPAHRWYEVPMAPPMAADALGRPPITMAALASETAEHLAAMPPSGIALVEGAGGPRSPLAHDGDSVDLARSIGAGLVVLVADAGLGTINAVRLSAAALSGFETIVMLNRFDPMVELHRRNRDWLTAAGYDPRVEVDRLATDLIDRLP